jgi:hypothetical protein
MLAFWIAALKMEAVCSSETSVSTYMYTQRYNLNNNIDIFT